MHGHDRLCLHVRVKMATLIITYSRGHDCACVNGHDCAYVCIHAWASSLLCAYTYTRGYDRAYVYRRGHYCAFVLIYAVRSCAWA
jgi:hypothetical protein